MAMRYLAILLIAAGLSGTVAAEEDGPEDVIGLTVASYEGLKHTLNQLTPSATQQLAFMGVNSGMATTAASMNEAAEAHFGRTFFCISEDIALNDELAETVMSLALANYGSSGFNDRAKDEVPAGTFFLSALMWQFPCR